jgi:integrase
MLKPYRRHTRECLNGTPDQPKLGLLNRAPKLKAEKLRTWEHCKCPVWFSGTWNGVHFPRQSLQCNDWKTGERMVQKKMEDSNKGIQSIRQTTIADALEKWIVAARLAHCAERTIDGNLLMQKRLNEWAKRHHYELLCQLTSDVLNQWRSEWCVKMRNGRARPLAETSERTRLTILKGFFNHAVAEDWLEKSPMLNAKLPPTRPKTKEDTTPVDIQLGSDANYRAILDAAPAALAETRSKNGGREMNELRRQVPNMLALMKLMYEAGFRCSDALVFDPDRLVLYPQCGEYTYTQIKSKRVCTTFLPLWLVAEIEALPRLSSGLPFFSGPDNWDPKSKSATKPLLQNGVHVTHMLTRIGEFAGVPNLHAHRFRNGFAVNLLNKGRRIEDVSAMLGHASIQMTQDYYSPWVNSRRDALRESYVRSIEPPPTSSLSPRLPTSSPAVHLSPASAGLFFCPGIAVPNRCSPHRTSPKVHEWPVRRDDHGRFRGVRTAERSSAAVSPTGPRSAGNNCAEHRGVVSALPFASTSPPFRATRPRHRRRDDAWGHGPGGSDAQWIASGGTKPPFLAHRAFSPAHPAGPAAMQPCGSRISPALWNRAYPAALKLSRCNPP